MSLGRVLLSLIGLLVALAAVRLLTHRRRRRRGEPGDLVPMRWRRPLVLGTIAFAGLVTFAQIAQEVHELEADPIDRRAELTVHIIDTPWLDVIMRGISWAGSAVATIVAVTLVIVWCLARKKRRMAGALAFVGVFNEGVNLLIKELFKRARPTLFEEMETLHSYSFPSGHAMSAAAVYGMMAVVVSHLEPRLAKPLTFVAPVFIFLVGFSRVYLGVHWPSDVLAGWAAGTVMLVFGLVAMGQVKKVAPPVPVAASAE
ncbi:MAG: phosphatase PAP2 family protein [Polyangiales bacterium]